MESVIYNGLEISQGTYTDEVTTENSLIANNMQRPEIMDAVFNAFPKYSMANMKSALYDLPETSIGDIKVRYPVLGRLEKALTLTGTFDGTFAVNELCHIEAYEDFARPTSTWRFPDGRQIVIQSTPSQSLSGYTYPCKVMPGTYTTAFDTTQITDMQKIGHVGNVNPMGSKRGYGNTRFPNWYENYNTIVRKRQEVDGTAASAVTWLRSGDQSYWIPGAAWGNNGFVNTMFGGGRDGGFLYLQERMAWYGQTTVDANGQPGLYDEDGKPVFAGSGIFEQVPSAMTFDWDMNNSSEGFWIDRVAQFRQNSGQMSGTIDLEGGIGFIAEWTKQMKRFINQTGGFAQNYMLGADKNVNYGYDVVSYKVLDFVININENPLFSDPELLTDVDGNTGFPDASFDFVMIDRTNSDGIPTIQKIVKKDRGFVYKTIEGMVNPINPASVSAANSWDGWAVEMLCDSQYIVRKPNCIARGLRTA